MSRHNPENDALTRENDELRRQLAELKRDPGDLPVTGCGDSSCIVAQPKGMATNGGCRCDPHAVRQALQYWRRLARLREQTIREMRAQGNAIADVLKALSADDVSAMVVCAVSGREFQLGFTRTERRYRVCDVTGDRAVLVETAQEAADCFATWLREARGKRDG